MSEGSKVETKYIEQECSNCDFFVDGECRRNAPTIQGFPETFPQNWCGEWVQRRKLHRKVVVRSATAVATQPPC